MERQRWLAALESITSCSERDRSDGEDGAEDKGEKEDGCERYICVSVRNNILRMLSLAALVAQW